MTEKQRREEEARVAAERAAREARSAKVKVGVGCGRVCVGAASAHARRPGRAQAEEAARLKTEEKRRWWDNAQVSIASGDAGAGDDAARADARRQRMKDGASRAAAAARCPRAALLARVRALLPRCVMACPHAWCARTSRTRAGRRSARGPLQGVGAVGDRARRPGDGR